MWLNWGFNSQPPDYSTCANPESFVRGGPTLTTFLFIYFLFICLADEGREDPSTTINGTLRHTSETSLTSSARQQNAIKWRCTGVPMLTGPTLYAGLVAL